MQAANAAPSSLHRNVTPASVSVNEKLAEVALVGFAGFEVIDGAGGGVESIVNVALACDPAGVVFPALSVARA